MQNQNPYYLHEENQMNVYDKPLDHPEASSKKYLNTNEDFAGNSSNANINQYQHPSIYNPPPQNYQPPSYPPVPYPYQQQPYIPYQPVQPYQQNPIPVYRQYDQSSRSSGKQGMVDHCPYCNKVTQSIIQDKLSKLGYFVCCLLLCVTVVLFWLPFCFPFCRQKRVKCVNCGRTKFVIRNDCG